MKSRSSLLVDKSIECMISAIEIYNKPDFKYREDAFCILAINAWELLLKAKILKNNKNNLSCIRLGEYRKTKSGGKSKRLVYRRTRSGNYCTIDITHAMKRLFDRGEIDSETYENISILIELRDNAIHFVNKNEVLSRKISELGIASISNYNSYLFKWFAASLGKYNIYLMPMALVNESDYSASILGDQDKTIDNILRFISEKEQKYPSDTNKAHNLTISIDIRLAKASKIDPSRQFAISANGKGPTINVTPEDMSKVYPIEYRTLITKLRERFSDFKVNEKFYELKENLEQKSDLCYFYPLNPKNPSGSTKKMYSTKMISAFDDHYTKRSPLNLRRNKLKQ